MLAEVSIVREPEEPHARRYTVDDDRLWEAQPTLTAEQFGLEDVSDEEWKELFEALAE